ncbi:MAG: cyclic nucleotide-binding domain-containing protein [FCB group bacterium]|nr:cyclic nucleotide-binding domain-containing protein [FCB group bacterium]
MDRELLKQYSIFNNLEDDEIDHFFEVIKEVNVPAGEYFIREGEVGDSIYLLLDGEVEINQALTLALSRGDTTDNREKAIITLSSDIHPLFGEMSLFNTDDKRTASVKALTDCKLARIMKPDLFRICDSHPEIGYKVMLNLCRVLCSNLVKANQNVLKLTTAFSLVLER